MTGMLDDDEPDLYDSTDGTAAYSEYTVYVDIGEAESKFKTFIRSLGAAVDTDWKDRHWK